MLRNICWLCKNKGGGEDFQKNFENIVDFFLDRPNWFFVVLVSVLA